MVKLDKCEFAQPKLKALGHIIDRHGVSPDPEKVEADRAALINQLQAERYAAANAPETPVSNTPGTALEQGEALFRR